MQAIVLLTEILKVGWPLWSKQACASKSRKAAWPLWSKEAIPVYRDSGFVTKSCIFYKNTALLSLPVSLHFYLTNLHRIGLVQPHSSTLMLSVPKRSKRLLKPLTCHPPNYTGPQSLSGGPSPLSHQHGALGKQFKTPSQAQKFGQ